MILAQGVCPFIRYWWHYMCTYFHLKNVWRGHLNAMDTTRVSIKYSTGHVLLNRRAVDKLDCLSKPLFIALNEFHRLKLVVEEAWVHDRGHEHWNRREVVTPMSFLPPLLDEYKGCIARFHNRLSSFPSAWWSKWNFWPAGKCSGLGNMGNSILQHGNQIMVENRLSSVANVLQSV